jgi:hypothetical protein
MRTWLLGVSAVFIASCGVIEVNVKPHAVSTNISTHADASAVCSAEPFGSSVIDFAQMAKDAGLDLSVGCLKSAAFQVVAEVTSLTGGTGCAEPRGRVTLSDFNLEMTCGDATKQTVTVTCPSPNVDVADGTDVFQKLNACLDLVGSQKSDELRKAINSCRPSTMRAFGRGSCSADTCFAASFKMTFKLLSATAQLGGTCG